VDHEREGTTMRDFLAVLGLLALILWGLMHCGLLI
jgi:hypothetical protein